MIGLSKEIDGTEAPAEDGPDLGGVTCLLPMPGIVAELEIDAVPESLLRGVRQNKKRS